MSEYFRGRLDVPCPECGAMLRPTLQDVKMQRTIRCRNGHDVRLVDKDRGVAKLDQEMQSLQQALRRIDRRR